MATKKIKTPKKNSVKTFLDKYKKLENELYKINDKLLEKAYKQVIKTNNLDKNKITAYYFPDAEEGEIGGFELLYDDTFSIIIESQDANSNYKMTYYVKLSDL